MGPAEGLLGRCSGLDLMSARSSSAPSRPPTVEPVQTPPHLWGGGAKRRRGHRGDAAAWILVSANLEQIPKFVGAFKTTNGGAGRSEERRVGKECRSRWS